MGASTGLSGRYLCASLSAGPAELAFANAEDGWAVSGATHEIWATYDAGVNWILVSSLRARVALPDAGSPTMTKSLASVAARGGCEDGLTLPDGVKSGQDKQRD